jgi:hypothetical protein
MKRPEYGHNRVVRSNIHEPPNMGTGGMTPAWSLRMPRKLYGRTPQKRWDDLPSPVTVDDLVLHPQARRHFRPEAAVGAVRIAAMQHRQTSRAHIAPKCLFLESFNPDIRSRPPLAAKPRRGAGQAWAYNSQFASALGILSENDISWMMLPVATSVPLASGTVILMSPPRRI